MTGPPPADMGHRLLDDDYFQKWKSRPEIVDMDARSLAYEMYFDIDGNPMPFSEWTRGACDQGYRRIADDRIGLFRVSTIWLGIDHSWGTGTPIIFETMVLLDGTVEDFGMQRYCTKEEARAGHEAVCAELRVTDQQAADGEAHRVYGPDEAP